MIDKIINRLKKAVPNAKEIRINFSKREDGLEWGNIEFTTDLLNGFFTVGFLIYDIKSENFTLTASDEDIKNNLNKMEIQCQTKK